MKEEPEPSKIKAGVPKPNENEETKSSRPEEE